MKTKLSIIIPVYNIENYIIGCLKSVEKQVADGCEVIIINDGSTDNSEKLILDFIGNKSGYNYIKQDNKGLSEARNTGIRAAEGEYLLFLDGDDMLYNNSLSGLLNNFLSECVPEVIICRYVEEDDITGKRKDSPDFPKISVNNPFEFYDKFVNDSNNWLSAWSCVIKRVFLQKNNLYFKKGLFHEDELWVIQVLSHVNKLFLCNYPIHVYRVNRRGSIMASVSYKHLRDKLYICRELYNIRDKENMRVLNRRITRDMFSIILSTRFIKNKSEFEKLKKEFKINSVYLKTKEGIILYFIYKIFGLDMCKKIVTLLKKDQYNV